MNIIHSFVALNPEIGFSIPKFSDYLNGLVSNLLFAVSVFLGFVLLSMLVYWAIIYIGLFLNWFSNQTNQKEPVKKITMS